MTEVALARGVGMIGAGSVTAGWAARFLGNGVDVRLYLPGSGDPAELHEVLARAERTWRRLTMVPLPTRGRLSLTSTPEAAVVGTGLVHVGAEVDAALMAAVLAAAPHDAPVALGGPSLASEAPQVVNVRAFDPVYLLPLVELKGGSAAALAECYRQLGMEPAFVTEGNGSAMRDAFGPGLLAPLAGAATPKRRDDGLVAILQGLRAADLGAGAALRRYELALLDRTHARPMAEGEVPSAPLRLLQTQVPADWIDYNGHLNESRYLQFFSDGSDALLAYVGVDAAYHAQGWSWYTVETHLRHFRELPAQVPVAVESQVLGFDGKRLHLFQRLWRCDEQVLAASAEQMLIHVDARAGRACPAAGAVRDRLERLAAAHLALPAPEDVGRRIRSLSPA